MRVLMLIMLFPLFVHGNSNLDSIIAIPYDDMVSNLHGSKSVLESAITLAEEEKNVSAKAEIYSKLSTVTYLLGEHELSLKYGIDAIHLFEILTLIAEGFSSKQIGEQLFISPRTVDTHRTNLMNKLDIHNIAGLMRFALKNGYS